MKAAVTAVWSSSTESVARAGSTILLLLQERPDIALPLFSRCAQRAANAVDIATAGGTLHPPPLSLGAGGNSVKGKRSVAGGMKDGASGSGVLPYPDIADLLLLVMRSRPLQPALVSRGAEFLAEVKAVVAIGQGKAELAADAGCRAASIQLQQVSRDLFS